MKVSHLGSIILHDAGMIRLRFDAGRTMRVPQHVQFDVDANLCWQEQRTITPTDGKLIDTQHTLLDRMT